MGFHVSITKIGIRTGSAICISVASSPTMNTWVSRQLRQADSTKSSGSDSTQHLENGEQDASVTCAWRVAYERDQLDHSHLPSPSLMPKSISGPLLFFEGIIYHKITNGGGKLGGRCGARNALV